MQKIYCFCRDKYKWKYKFFKLDDMQKKYAGSVAETNIAQEILHFAENKMWNKNNTTDWNWHKLWEKKQKKVLHHVFYVEEQPSFNWGTKVIENMTIIPILMMMMMMIIIMMVMMMIMMMTRIATKSAVHDRRTNSSWIDCLPDRCCCRCRKNLLIVIITIFITIIILIIITRPWPAFGRRSLVFVASICQ